MNEMPERIYAIQVPVDRGGRYWTPERHDSGSEEYVRADTYKEEIERLKAHEAAWDELEQDAISIGDSCNWFGESLAYRIAKLRPRAEDTP